MEIEKLTLREIKQKGMKMLITKEWLKSKAAWDTAGVAEAATRAAAWDTAGDAWDAARDAWDTAGDAWDAANNSMRKEILDYGISLLNTEGGKKE